jgi:tetratricopeptide (TPR) repeat protein
MNRIVQAAGMAVLAVLMALHLLSPELRCQESTNPEVVRHFNSGQQDLRSGRLGDAVQEFQAVIRLAPSLSEARINLGLTYHLLGEYRLAVAQLDKGLGRNPQVLGANIILGIDELRLGAPASAVPPLEHAVQMDPSNQQAWSSLADAYLALGDFREATRAYVGAFGKNPKAEDLFHLGHAYLRMSSQLTARMAHEYGNTACAKRLAGDLLSERQLWSDAAQRYQWALALDPTDPGLHLSLGNALLEQGKWLDARREYLRELTVDSASPQALLALAEIELEQGHRERTLIYAAKLARTDPRSLSPPAQLTPELATKLAGDLVHAQSEPGVHVILAELYQAADETAQSSKQRALAQSDFKRWGDVQPPGWPACKAGWYSACVRYLQGRRHLDTTQLLELGSALFAMREYERASDAFAAAVARRLHDPQPLYWLIRAYSKVADQYFSRLAERYPDSPQAHQLEAESYRARGQDGKAITQYQRAAAIQPNNALLHEALGELYLDKHQLSEARKELEEALELDPTRPRALYLMGRLEIGLQKPQVAIPYLERALRYDPQLLEARASLGLAYLRAGKAVLAVPQFERSMSLDYYGDLHYMLYQAYLELGKTVPAENALATSQALRRKTQFRDQALIRSAENQ